MTQEKKIIKELITTFTAEGRYEVSYPVEYIEMKFCETFHLTPFEMSFFPVRKMKLWLAMKAAEQQAQKRRGSK